ncbi:hypothetical protein ONZ45_g13436 [Pleurotus djamor]|nr:hypothetical protein ONZ45_g13436 [Pleurotus djamor]
MASEWSKWQRITAFIRPGKSLYRAAGPNPTNSVVMSLTPTAINYLRSLGIDGVFCIGTWPFVYDQLQNLQAKGIEYKHISVTQTNPPTPQTLEAMWKFFLAHKSILIYDGDAQWRSGIAITAIQLFSTGGKQPAPALWKNNGVVNPAHIDMLKVLQKKLIGPGPQPSSSPPPPPRPPIRPPLPPIRPPIRPTRPPLPPTRPLPPRPPLPPTSPKKQGGKDTGDEDQGNPDWYHKPVY